MIIKKKHYGENHIETAVTMENMANLFYHQENYLEALEFYEKVLIIKKKRYGENHVETATTMENIAKVL